MASADAEMQSYYASRAREYDNVYLKPERQSDLRDIERWLPPIFTSARVLEIACGTGYWTRFIAPLAASIVAVDIAPEMLAMAGARTSPSNIEYRIADAYDLPWAEATFDAAFAGFWFSHVPRGRRAEFLARLNLALHAGAKVVLIDNLYVDGSSSPVIASDCEGNTYQTRVLDDGSTHKVLKNFPSEAELREAVTGLADSAIFKSWQYYWAFEYVVAAP